MSSEEIDKVERRRQSERAREARRRKRAVERRRELDLPDKLSCHTCWKDRTWYDKRELRGSLTHVWVVCSYCKVILMEMDVPTS